MKQHDVIISGVHLELTEAIKNMVHEKVEKLFEHEDRIIRLRVELEYNQNITKQKEFIAHGHIEVRGNDHVVSVETEDLYKSIDLMVQKLDRMLRRRSRLDKVKRKHPHSIDIPSAIPKAV